MQKSANHRGLALGHTQGLRREIRRECVVGALGSHRPTVVVLALVLAEHTSYLARAMTAILQPTRVQPSSLPGCQRPGLGSHARTVQRLGGNIAAWSVVRQLHWGVGGLCHGRILSLRMRSRRRRVALGEHRHHWVRKEKLGRGRCRERGRQRNRDSVMLSKMIFQ